MATVSTTTNSNPLRYPASTYIDVQPRLPPNGAVTGYMFVLVLSSTANTFEFWRSTDNGASWSLFTSIVRTNVSEAGPIHIDENGWLHWVYRTSESSQDRVYYRRADATGTWSSEVLVDSFANGGVAGSVWQGMDLMVVNYGKAKLDQAVMVVAGVNTQGKLGLSMWGVQSIYPNAPKQAWGLVCGPRFYLPDTGSGRVGPSLDLEHAGGNGKTSGVPNLWVSFGRTRIYIAKFAWNGNGWNTPTAALDISGSVGARDYIPGRWDGNRFLVVKTHAAGVLLYERNKSHTSLTLRTTPDHPQSTTRSVGIGYNAANGDPRVFAVGTSNNDLYYVDFSRTGGTWGSWVLVTATDILGSGVDNYSIARATPKSRFEVLTADSGSPNNIVHRTLALVAAAPMAPQWNFNSVPYVNGSAADANAALTLDWDFLDIDTTDVQTAYALSRQIGNGLIEYWRASDGTWQATEQKNSTATTQVTLPTGFVDRFDTGVSGWTPTAGTFVASSVQARSGGTSGLLTTTGTPAQTFVRYENAATVGLQYTAEIWALSVGGYGDVGVAIDWFTSGHAYISTSTSGGSALTAGVWGRRTVTATAPATTAFAQFGPTVGSNPPTSTAVYVDDTSFGLTPTPWAAASDANHTYKVKTWDSGDLASIYSNPLVLVPSAKVNPTITTPADTSVYTLETLTVTWTAAEQSAFQIKLLIFGELLYDSGKVLSTATTYEVPYRLINNFSFSLQLSTWNNEGLKSDTVQSNFSVVFVGPATPTHVASPTPALGYISVQITNPDQTIAVVNTGTVAHGNNASVNPGLPASMTAGDAMFVVSAIRNSGTGTPNQPSGYSTITTFGNIGLFAKLHTGSESSPTCSYTGGVANADTTAQMVAFRRAGIVKIGTAATQLNGSAQNISYPALTVSTNNCIVFYFVWKQDDSTGTSVPAGFTEIGDLSTITGDDQTVVWGYQIQTTATNISSGTLTVTGGASAISRAVLVSVSGIPTVLGNDVYRLKTGAPLTEGTRVGRDVSPNGVVLDWRAPAAIDWSYRVFAKGDNGSSSPGAWAP